MSRRLDIELTSERPDGSWTWRAAGAKQPKGDLDGSLLPAGTGVGAVLRVEAEFLLDGIEIVAVHASGRERKEPQRLEILGSGREEPLVTTQLAPKGRGRRDRGDWGDRDDRGRRDRGGRGDRGDRGERGRRERGDRDDRPRGPRPDPVPERPAPKRLRPGRAHRSAVLDDVAPEMRPIAEQVLRGGIPAVREQANRQNEQARKENRPEIPVDQVVAMAEQLLPRLRTAEWRDRAEAALRDLDELDLRDLRSVVVAAENAARDDETRALRDQLSAGLNRRVEEEQRNWVADITANLDAGRFVRALRISSRPPKAGAPVPKDLADRLVADVSAGLSAGTRQELYAATLDALSFSPVRNLVTPAGRPAEPTEELLEAVRRVADKLPSVAALFGVDPKEAKAARRRRKAAGPRAGAQKAQGDKQADKQAEGRSRAKGSGATPGAERPADGGATSPAAEPAQPTNAAAQPAAEAVEPAAESTEAAEPTTEAAEPTTEAVEPAAESTEAAEPTTEAAEPTTEAAEPTTEAAEPTTEAAPAEPADTAPGDGPAAAD
jgi:hypothetical protein